MSNTSKGFSLIELLTVIAVISILMATTTSIMPSLFRANVVDANITTLSGIFEQAREAAISGNTYVYVLFSNSLANSPSGGVGVIVLQSEDGTDPLAGFSTPSPSSAQPIPFTDLTVLHKFQALPGILQPTNANVITSSSTPGITTLPTPAAAAASLTTLDLTMTTGGTAYTFTQGVMFKPDGEVLNPYPTVPWNALVEFGVKPAQQSSQDVAVMRLTRLTGRLTVYRQQ